MATIAELKAHYMRCRLLRLDAEIAAEKTLTSADKLGVVAHNLEREAAAKQEYLQAQRREYGRREYERERIAEARAKLGR